MAEDRIVLMACVGIDMALRDALAVAQDVLLVTATGRHATPAAGLRQTGENCIRWNEDAVARHLT